MRGSDIYMKWNVWNVWHVLERCQRSKRVERSQRFLNVCPNCQAQILADVPGKPFLFEIEIVTSSPLYRFSEFFRAGYIINVRNLYFLFFLTHPSLIMVSKQYRNRFFVARFIFEKSFPVMFFCFGCKTTNFDRFEKLCIVVSNNDVCSRCVRFGRHCDLFISEFVC